MGLPEPLHPALVHFPIAFSIIALALGIWALFTRKIVPYMTIFLFITIGVVIVTQLAGSYAASTAGQLSAEDNALIDEHANWSIIVLVMTSLATLCSLVTWIVSRRGRAGLRWFWTILTLIFLCLNTWAVFETAKRGGAMVYEHGIGVKAQGTNIPRE